MYPTRLHQTLTKMTAYVKLGLLMTMTLFAAQVEFLKSRLSPTKTSMPAVTEVVAGHLITPGIGTP
jgi:hypothetical protein